MTQSAVTVSLNEVCRHFEDLEDPRSTINRLHPLPSIRTISLMAVLAGADGPAAIRKWAVLKQDLLLQTLDLPNGIPSRDAIRRVLSVLRVEAFQSCFVNWLKSLREAADIAAGIGEDGKCHLAIDGKTMKGSHNRAKGLGPMPCQCVAVGSWPDTGAGGDRGKIE